LDSIESIVGRPPERGDTSIDVRPGRDNARSLLSPLSSMRPAFRCLLLMLTLLFAALTFAQPNNPTDAALEATRTELEGIQKRLRGDVPDAELAQLREAALRLQSRAEALAVQLTPELNKLQARLAELGPAPAAGTEAADVAEQRRALGQARDPLDAQVKLAGLLAVESEQAAEQLTVLRRSRFQARLGERTSSILAGPFWRELGSSLQRDRARVAQLDAEFAAAADATPAGLWLALLAASVLAIGLRWWAGRALRRFTANRVPAGRLRRSLLALALTLLSVLAPTFIAHALRLVLTAQHEPSDAMQSLLVGFVGSVAFGAYVAGLGGALLAHRRPSWRLAPLPDAVATRMRRYPLALALVIIAGALLERLAGLVNAGLATAVAINCVFALALGSLMCHALLRGAKLRRDSEPATDAQRGIARTLARLLIQGGWLVLVFSLLCLLVGYVALGSFIVKQVVWIATMLATAWLLCALIDDAAMGLLAAAPAADAEADAAHEPAPLLRNQAAVLLSALGRLAVMLVALVLIAAPFGQGPSELLQRADQLRDGIAVGEIQIKPAALLQAVLVFVLGMLGVRALQHWLTTRFLPTTRLDAGMRASATTLLGTVGAVFAVALALSAIGLGLERIAWVASALSVGIGFGLQAVVQNFVSGLIMLAERPVKVGDWVALGGIEGDIRRINVRATEIQMGDRSTVIVPNSEFITKAVRNITHANPLGLVTIKLPMPLDTKVDEVRALLLAALTEHEDVVDNPPPTVHLEGIEGGALVFNASGMVSSPRKAYGVKSALLFDILGRLRGSSHPLAKPPTMLLRDAPPVAPPAAG
jgi:small-conductance mechanosensitive channel